MKNILLAIGIFFLYVFVVIVSYAVLDQPVTNTINSFTTSTNISQVTSNANLIMTSWHMTPVVLLSLGLLWLLFWIHRREPEEYLQGGV